MQHSNLTAGDGQTSGGGTNYLLIKFPLSLLHRPKEMRYSPAALSGWKFKFFDKSK
jgi:hypothetical protein